MKVQPIPHVSFETARSGFIQTLHHCSVSWNIIPQYFFISNLYTLDRKSPSKWNFQTFEWLGENSLCHVWNYKSVFFKVCTTLQCHEGKLFCTFLAETVHNLDQRSPSKCKQSFRLSTAHAKFHEIYTLICSFCWKYIRF